MRELYQVLKDRKNPMIKVLVDSSYEHCCRAEMEILTGDAELPDSEDFGTEKAARVCPVNPAFNAVLQDAVKKLQDTKLVIDQFEFNPKNPNSAATNDEMGFPTD